MTDKTLVMVACANKREALTIARAAIEARLAACANVLPWPMDSIYRWKGNVEQAKEVLLLMKTSRKKIDELSELVKKLHSYEVPEFIAMPIVDGSPDYLAWLEECVAGPAARKRTARRSGS